MEAYEGKRVFVSGGSQGLGRAVALQLAAAGAHVCIAARGVEALEEAVAAMKQAAAARDTRLIARSLDVTDSAAVEAAAAEVVAELGGLDLLICRASPTAAASTSCRPRISGG